MSPLGGTFADRYSRRKIIIVCDLIHGASVLSLAALIFIAPQADNLIVAWLAVVAVISGVVSAFFMPAVKAAIPSIVPAHKVAAANSFNEGSFEISTLIGQGAGGILFRVLGAPVLFFIDGLTFLYSAVSEMFMDIPQAVPEKTRGWREEFARFDAETREGFRYAWERVGMRDLFLAAAVLNFFSMPFFVLFPFYVEDVLGVSPDWYGFLLAGFGGGSLLGYTFISSVRMAGRTRGKMLVAFLVLVSVCMGAMGFVDRPFLSLSLMIAAGFISGVFNITTLTLIQQSTPEEKRGRMFGLLNTLVMGLAPVSMGLTGVVADLIGHNVSVMFIICGAVLVAVSLTVSTSRDFREFLSLEIEQSR
jgi:MFS family permease